LRTAPRSSDRCTSSIHNSEFTIQNCPGPQPRFFDRALRSVKEYYEKVEYVHLDAVRAGFVKRAEEWQWSSVQDYTGGLSATFRPNRTLASDRVLLPADERERI
jgi:hypothetical protein